MSKGSPGSSNGNARLTEDQVASMRIEYASGAVSREALAEKHHISVHTVSGILKGHRWKSPDLPAPLGEDERTTRWLGARHKILPLKNGPRESDVNKKYMELVARIRQHKVLLRQEEEKRKKEEAEAFSRHGG